MGHRITEIAALRMRGGEPEESFHSLINPLRAIPPSITEMTGIDHSMVSDAPEFYEIAENFIKFIEGSVLVFHNAPFDLRFLAPGICAIRPEAEYPVVDTLVLARNFFSFSGNSLGKIAEQLGIKIDNAHRAMDDVAATAKILKYFISCLMEDKHITTLGDLLELQGVSVRFPDYHPGRIPHLLKDALRTGRMLRFRYVTVDGIESVREAEPREIIIYSKNVYLTAFCCSAGGIQVFRLDRISGFTSVQ